MVVWAREKLSLLEGASLCAESGFTPQTLAAITGLNLQKDVNIKSLIENLQRRSLLEYNKELDRYIINPFVKRVIEKRLEYNPDRKITLTRNHCTYFLHFIKENSNNLDALIREKDEIWQVLIQTGYLRDRNAI